jgi:hypothetical protein
VAPDRPDLRALVHGQPHDLAASLAARERCEALLGGRGSCEIVRLGDERVTTGQEIRERVPDEPHPLFLWRYTRGTTTLYLAGSIHILKPTIYPLPAQLTAAFRQASHLVLEVDVHGLPPAELQRRTLARARLPDGQTLHDVLPAPLLRRLETRLAAYGITLDMVNRAKPALVMNQLVVSRLLALGYLPDSGLESHFLAQRTHQQVLELESLDDQLALLFDQPIATQVALLAETLDVEREVEPLLAGMLVAWLSGDDATFLELFEAQAGDSAESRAFNEALLDERNRGMAAGIRRLLEGSGESPRRYFVLVGAAHLVGEQGIVQLLARQGIHGRRIRSTDPIPLP